MKKINLLLIFCALSLAIYAQDSKVLTLKDAVTGKYNGERLGELVPMADGEHYTMMSNDRKRIVKYSFKTGKEVETLFDVSTARECTFKTFDGYQLSPDETKILIQTVTKG
jgi:dipeptidyl-peptidase-4